jgi:hypothetical protein
MQRQYYRLGAHREITNFRPFRTWLKGCRGSGHSGVLGDVCLLVSFPLSSPGLGSFAGGKVPGN